VPCEFEKEENVMGSGITPDIAIENDSDYMRKIEKLL